jgi:hypothetical protein
MQKTTSDLVWRILGSILAPLCCPEYRRLLIRSYVLTARLELLCIFFAVTSPFATPGLLMLVRRWLDGLREDVAEFGRLVRSRRARVAIPRAQPTPQISSEGEYQNPWT